MKKNKRLIKSKRILESKRLMKVDFLITPFELKGGWTTTEEENSLLEKIVGRTSATLSVIGQTVKGKDIPALTIGTGERKCLITSGVHRSEKANREGILIKARDICFDIDGKYTEYLKDHTVMIIPTLNIDSSSYRNADSIDINRVIYYLDSPEGIAFLRTLRDFDPDVYFDFHEHSGGGDTEVRFVRAMGVDPNSDLGIRNLQKEAIDYVQDKFNQHDITTDYYFKGNTGFGSLTSGVGVLGKICFTTETSIRHYTPEERVERQKESFDYCLGWHKNNHSLIDDVYANFKDNMLKKGDTFTLLQGMKEGAEMYTQARHEEIVCPYGYKLDDINEFQDFIDIYGIEIEGDGIVPVNQKTGRMIPHLLDVQSDMRVTTATRIE